MAGEVKEFSTGSLGWYANGKVDLHVGDIAVKVQVGGNLTIVGSKELPKTRQVDEWFSGKKAVAIL